MKRGCLVILTPLFILLFLGSSVFAEEFPANQFIEKEFYEIINDDIPNKEVDDHLGNSNLNVIKRHEAEEYPVHQWIGFQAKFIYSEPEIEEHLPTNWPTANIINELNSHEITLGTYEEDHEADEDLFDDCWGDHPYCTHFMNPQNTDEGLKIRSADNPFKSVSWESAYHRAQTLWNFIIPWYKENKKGVAYYWLGRVAHLLTDMSVPAHVNKSSTKYGDFDIHWEAIGILSDPDDYENFMRTNFNFMRWSAENRNYTPSNSNTLEDLFISMASIAHRYDSNDAVGSEDKGERQRDGFTDEELSELANILMPEAMKHVARLYQLFWDEAHSSENMPTVASFQINNDVSSTTSRMVTLNNACTENPTHYKASESSSFDGTTWKTYSTAPSFTLSWGNGTKTVWFKVKNSSGESSPASDTITLGSGSSPVVTSFQINNEASSTTSRTVTLNNSCTGSPTHYMASESSSFSGAYWKFYSAAPSFTISSGNGIKTIYFKVRNPYGKSSPVDDTITLSTVSMNRPPTMPE